MGLSIVTEPYREPIHLDDAKQALKIDASITAEDSHLTGNIIGAREKVEGDTGLALVVSTWDQTFDSFPASSSDPLELRRRPAVSISSITYVDTAGDSQTWAAANYILDKSTNKRPPAIHTAFDVSWPDTRAIVNAVTVRFIAGFITPITSVSAPNDTVTVAGRTFADADIVRLYNSDDGLPSLSLPDPLVDLTDYHVVSTTGSTFGLALTSGGASVVLTDSGEGLSFVGLLPQNIRVAMLMLLGHWNLNREAVVIDGPVPMEVKLSYEALIQKWVLPSVAR